jgi:hypothetical protein
MSCFDDWITSGRITYRLRSSKITGGLQEMTLSIYEPIMPSSSRQHGRELRKRSDKLESLKKSASDEI